MLFNSVEFLVFFLVVLAVYYPLSHRAQNRWLWLCSYFFYGFWDWRYVALIFWVANVDYFSARAIAGARSRNSAKFLLGFSLVSNFSLLAYFKYWNFFLTSLQGIVAWVGFDASFPSWEVVLPVGISFFVFQSTAYVIDVYRGTTRACNDYADYLLFGSFFPQLVAGPIERSGRLLLQILQPRQHSPADVYTGLVEMLWGLFKKICVADHLSVYVDAVYQSHAQQSGPTLALATVMFAFQIYCDFSAYSDMARGMSRIMGFDLMINFSKPYSSRNLQEFWRRWHISLSTWFRDYLYIPLGGSQGTALRSSATIILVFLVSGLWHGARWTFVIWGLWHGLGLLISRYMPDRLRIPRAVATTLTFTFVCFGWVYFRADSIPIANEIISRICSASGSLWINQGLGFGLLPLLAMIALEIFSGQKSVPVWFVGFRLGSQVIFISAFALASLLFASKAGGQFIYFQF